MSNKSEIKKKYILEKACEVFKEKGYKSVSMKDIVEACEISRGGLYLYYKSTEEIFLDVLRAETERSDRNLEKELAGEATPTDIMMVFFKAQKAEAVGKQACLGMAMYEYYAVKSGKGDNLIRDRFESGVLVLQILIEMGIKTGEFRCAYPNLEAHSMMYALEGMKIMAQTARLSSKEFDKEIIYLLSRIVAE